MKALREADYYEIWMRLYAKALVEIIDLPAGATIKDAEAIARDALGDEEDIEHFREKQPW